MPDQNYSSFGQGLVGGMIGSIQKRHQRERELEDESRNNALKWLQSIPMSEQNAPIVTKLALDVLSSRPGKKHWTDQIFGTGVESNRYIDDLWAKLRSILPDASMQEGVTAASGDEDYQEIPYIKDGKPVGIGEKSMIPLTGTPAASGWGLMKPEFLTPPTFPAAEAAAAIRPRPQLSQYGKISFDNLPGKWQRDPTIFYDEQGNAFQYSHDATGVRKPRRLDLGKVSTERQNIAEMNAQARAAATQQATFKAQTALAANLAQMDPQTFMALPDAAKAPYYTQAGQILAGQALDKRAKDAAQISTTQKRGQLYDALIASGGVNPGQVESNYMANLGPARKYVEEFDELVASMTAAKQTFDQLNNPTDPTSKALKTAGAPQYVTKLREAQAAYTRAQQAVQSKLAGAAAAFPGLISVQGGKLLLTAKPPVALRGGMGTPSASNFGDFGSQYANPATAGDKIVPPITMDMRTGTSTTAPTIIPIGKTVTVPHVDPTMTPGKIITTPSGTFVIMQRLGADANGQMQYKIRRIK